MTKRIIDRHIENLSPFVKDLQHAAFRAGAEAARDADCLAACVNCEDGVPLEQNADRIWVHRRPSGNTTRCCANALRTLPLPEMDK